GCTISLLILLDLDGTSLERRLQGGAELRLAVGGQAGEHRFQHGSRALRREAPESIDVKELVPIRQLFSKQQRNETRLERLELELTQVSHEPIALFGCAERGDGTRGAGRLVAERDEQVRDGIGDSQL